MAIFEAKSLESKFFLTADAQKMPYTQKMSITVLHSVRLSYGRRKSVFVCMTEANDFDQSKTHFPGSRKGMFVQ